MIDCRILDRERRGGTISVGSGVRADKTAYIDTSANVTIGNDVWISEDVMILTHSHDPHTRELSTSPLVVDDDAWIGARVIVLESCSRIGKKSVIGAGSILTHDVPDNQVWAGNPARLIRKLEI
jgi:acetyltransferase-like isoleucine patch superfamily enzyme